MKTLTTLILVFLNIFIGFSQSEIYLKSTENITNIQTATLTGIGGRGFDNRFEGTKGSPLIFNSYKPGTILFTNNTKLENVYINFDNYSNLISFIEPESKDTLFVDNKTAHTVIILENKSLYQQIPNSYFDKKYKENTMFRLLEVNESYAVIKFRIVSLKKANYEGAYSADERYDEFLQEDRYFARIGDTKFIQIKPKKSSLIKAFPDKKQEILKFFKGVKFTDKDEMLVALFSDLY